MSIWQQELLEKLDRIDAERKNAEVQQRALDDLILDFFIMKANPTQQEIARTVANKGREMSLEKINDDHSIWRTGINNEKEFEFSIRIDKTNIAKPKVWLGQTEHDLDKADRELIGQEFTRQYGNVITVVVEGRADEVDKKIADMQAGRIPLPNGSFYAPDKKTTYIFIGSIITSKLEDIPEHLR